MAEGYLRKRSMEEGLGCEVKSAGTHCIDGATPSSETIKVLKNENINTEGLESTELTEEIIRWADLILVKEPMHREKVLSIVPQADTKLFLLGKFSKKSKDVLIPDPIGRPTAFYNFTFGLIKDSIEGLIEWLKKS